VGWWYESMPLTKDQKMVLNLRSPKRKCSHFLWFFPIMKYICQNLTPLLQPYDLHKRPNLY
jgi:hypothetical protein